MCRYGTCKICKCKRMKARKAIVEKRDVGQTRLHPVIPFTTKVEPNRQQTEKEEIKEGPVNKSVISEDIADIGKDIIVDDMTDIGKDIRAGISADINALKVQIQLLQDTLQKKVEDLQAQIKSMGTVNSGKNVIAHSYLHGDFRITTPDIINDEKAKNAIKRFMTRGYIVADPEMETNMNILRNLLGGDVYIKFFRGPIDNLIGGEGYPLGNQNNINRILYIHNIDDVHFQILDPQNSLLALRSIPLAIRRTVVNNILSI